MRVSETCPARHARNPAESWATGKIGYQLRADFPALPPDEIPAWSAECDRVGGTLSPSDPCPAIYAGPGRCPRRWILPSSCD